MQKSVSILGSTGSVGTQTLEVCREQDIKVVAITGNQNIDLLEAQAREFMPELVVVYDEEKYKNIKERLADTDIEIMSGMEGLITAAKIECDSIVTAVSGSIGLRPTIEAIKTGKRIALANKETLVCAGDIVMALASENNVEIIPVDSEHSAIFQCLTGRENELKKILLTASGGPFRGKTLEETENVTPQMAVAHPNWSMGAKISIDSATMMNKGLELIEAMHLFSCSYDEIEILIHPESIIHSAVELIDNTVIAQLGTPSMKLPIQYALSFPERKTSTAKALDLKALRCLNFYDIDLVNQPCLALAIDCAKQKNTAACVMSAANEEAVALFLQGKIGFNDIYRSTYEALSSIDLISKPNLDEILEADSKARAFIKEKYL